MTPEPLDLPAHQTIRLSDYRPFTHRIEQVELTFRLRPTETEVLARLLLEPDPMGSGLHDLRLDGENLTLLSLAIDGKTLSVTGDATGLTVPAELLPQGRFLLETTVLISPEGNTALEGLYMSNGMYCTQCEAEGFRKITYYPDRPDVMAPFRVRIESDLPVLLSNGNLTGRGPGWAEWHDPWPKPAYLFALVAGDLVAHSDRFVTASGRDVDLNIWVRPDDAGKCAYAMESLKRSMRWDETVYGREYDLDIFNIVAVDDFNMGAMENKGLNIFNSKYVLALPETATDDDFSRIEGIIAHEYFHNWTGNRITCRDWFQLCLKEGLTVFRDQQFTSDMRSGPVKRIEDVLTLRSRQFREDNGPLSHAVRPDHYQEINNFYTATVYEKGAEVIGMLKRLVGDADYSRALDLYFSRHDGKAATIEDWLKVFEDATGRDLSQFSRWYTDAGTPRLKVSETWQDGTYSLAFEQVNPPTPGQPDKQPKVIPIAVGLLNPNGDEVMATRTLEMTETKQIFRFPNLAARPIPSILRGFSAPVILERNITPEERAFLLAHDTDPFNKWEAGRALAKDVLVRMVTEDAQPGPDWLDALARTAQDPSLDPAFRALALRLPGEDDMAQTLFDAGVTPDPDRIHIARRRMAEALAKHLSPALPRLIDSLAEPGPFTPEARAAGRRALRLAVLSLQSRVDDGTRAAAAFRSADNMTEQVGALGCLLEVGRGQPELAAFEAQWGHDRLVMDKWFALQIGHATPDQTAAITDRLTRHPLFDWKNPNRFRSVIGAISANHAGFHHSSGTSYKLVADWLIRLDPINPQTAARMSTAFETWSRYDADRQALIQSELLRIRNRAGVSGDLAEMTGRLLGEED